MRTRRYSASVIEVRPDLSPYLLNVPTSRADHQCKDPRRQNLSGVIGWHVTGVPSQIWMQQMMQSIANNPAPASYHEMVNDGFEWCKLLPDYVEAYQVGVSPFNRHALALSAVMSESEWNPDSEATHNVLKTAAFRMTDMWERNGFDPEQGARFLDYSSGLYGTGGPGIINHGTLQPGDRSDSWVSLPGSTQDKLAMLLIDYILHGQGDDDLSAEDVAAINAHTTATAHQTKVDLWTQKIWHREDNSLWLVYRNTKIHLQSEADVIAAFENGAIVPANPHRTMAQCKVKHTLGVEPGEKSLDWKLDQLLENTGAYMALHGYDPKNLPPAPDDTP